MKKNLMSVALGAALALAAGPSVAQEFVISTHAAPTHLDSKHLTAFGERITKATNGKQTFKVMAGGVLAGGAAALASVKAGAFDATTVVFTYTPSEAPVHTFLGDLYAADTRVVAAAHTEAMLLNCPECMEEMKKQNVVILLGTAGTLYHIWCTAGSRVETLADLKGKKIRAVGSYGPLAAKLGATPVNVTIMEVYEALNRGQVDCAMIDASWLEPLQLFSVVKHVNMVPLGAFHSVGFVTVNRDTWNKLSAQDKQVWLDSAAVTVAEYEAAFIAEANKATEKARAGGMEMVKPEPALLKAVQDFRAAETPALAEQARKRGVKDPDAIAKAYQAAIDKWTKIVNGIGEGDWSEDQWKKYAEVLKTEVYSKIKPDHFK